MKKKDKNYWNSYKYFPEKSLGHYESYFQRANHPTRPIGFWIRYTMFVPDDGGIGVRKAIAALYAVYFDGEKKKNTSVYEQFDLSTASFSRETLDVKINDSYLQEGSLKGGCKSDKHSIYWDLSYTVKDPMILLFPRRFYFRKFPPAKPLVGSPNAKFTGVLEVDGEKINIDNWCGTQNHNWGMFHLEHYAWGQVAEFDGEKDSYLECATTSLKFGSYTTPMLSALLLKYQGKEYRLNNVRNICISRGDYKFFDWNVESKGLGVNIKVNMRATKEAFVAFSYPNPPGGAKTCLNSKIASCELILKRLGRRDIKLSSKFRAGFEILTDDNSHGVEVFK